MGFCAVNRAHSFFALCALSFCTILNLLLSGQTPKNVNLARRQQPPEKDPPGLARPPNVTASSPSANSTSESHSITPLALPFSSPVTPIVSSDSSPHSSGVVSSTSQVQLTSAPIIITPISTVVSTSSAPSSTTPHPSLTLTDGPTPSTTFVIGVDDSSTSTSTSSSPSSSSSLADPSTSANSVSTAPGTPFWQNKGAVAATFIFSILLAALLVAIFVVNLLKRRNARRQALIDAEFMPHDQDSRSRASSPAPSVHYSPMDPFSRREVVYDNVPTDTTNSSRSPHPARVVPTVQISPASSYSESQHSGPLSQLLGTPEMSTVQRNRLEVRTSTQSGYQPSFDSFYGAYSPTK